MRSIKFKAWDKANKKMREISSIHFGVQHGMARGDLVDYVELDGKSSVYIAGDEIDLLQFTGLLDKNGREIYEGDVVITNNEQIYGIPVEEHYQGVVTYDDKEGVYEIKQPHDSSYTPVLCNDAIMSMEVIGNIWENPDLLEEHQSEHK